MQHLQLIKVTLYYAKQFGARANAAYLFCITKWFMPLQIVGLPKEDLQIGAQSETELSLNP